LLNQRVNKNLVKKFLGIFLDNQTSYRMYSPKEQYIIYPVVSVNLVINNIIFFLLLAGSATLLLGNAFNIGNRVISNNWGIKSESLYRTILLMIETHLGTTSIIYLPLFYTIFY
jgi:vacuolar-type H+-ATPase subunit I/STV1